MELVWFYVEYSLDLSPPPVIEVSVTSPYTARIVIMNAEVNSRAMQEEKYVVRYRISPQVSLLKNMKCSHSCMKSLCCMS